MKQILYLMTLMISVVLISSCVPEDEDGEPDPDDVVTFADYNLERCVRDEMSEGSSGEVLYYKDVFWLSWLRCAGYGIEKLDGIENMKNLREAEFGNNKIKDVTLLGKCVKLEELNLSKNEIEDASPLGSLVNLTSLNIVSNAISDISYVSNLSELIKFHTSDNPVPNISAVSDLTNLTGLDFYKNEIESISDIKGLINLIGISVGDNCITDFSPIDYLKQNGKLVNILGDSSDDQDYSRCE